MIFVFGLALVLRLYDLTDLPLDFHPTRQLLSFIKARALYYQTQPNGISNEQLEAGVYLAKFKAGVEPVVFERLVAFTYGFTGEHVWVARIYSSLFWLIGGVFLFLLVRDLFSFEGALVATAYYLFVPYGVFASRSFQPDPLMVMLTLGFWWMFAKWIYPPRPMGERLGVRAALLSGLLGGFAIFIKFSAAFFVIGAALGLAFSRFTLRDLLRNGQVWAMAVLGVLPAGAYLVYGFFIKGGLGNQFVGRFIPALLLDPLNYLAWETKASFVAGGVFIMLGLLGMFVAQETRQRVFLVGLWGAYLVYGLFFDYHVATHDYYHVPFIPLVAVSLAPLGGWALKWIGESSFGWGRSVVYVVLIYGMLSNAWDVTSQLRREDYRPLAGMWQEISERVGDERVIALTEDYGSRMEYWGFKRIATWPTFGDLNYVTLRGGHEDFEKLFRKYSSQRDLFLVTDFDELARQPELKAELLKYTVRVQTDGYWLFDLNAPLEGTTP